MTNNKLQVPGLESAFQELKEEIALELGLYEYEKMDKGELSSRQNGQIGGLMTKRLIELGQQALLEQKQKK